MKVIVIGTNHGGVASARTLKQLDKNVEVTVYEKADDVAFLACSSPLWVKGEFKDPIFTYTPEEYKRDGINLVVNHLWEDLDVNKKAVKIKDLKTGKEFWDSYDKLIISCGSWPFKPTMEGSELKNIQIFKGYELAKQLKDIVNNCDIKNVVVVGGGFIGMEVASALQANGKKVTVIEAQDRIMSANFGTEITNMVEEAAISDGIIIKTSQKVQKFIGTNKSVSKVVTDKETIDTDYVVFSVGTQLQTNLLKGKIDLDEKGAMIVNDYMQTSNKDIYGIGDAAAVLNAGSLTNHFIAIAPVAARTGMIAATNIVKGNQLKQMGFTGQCAINLFGLKMAAAGITVENAKRYKMEVESVILEDDDLIIPVPYRAKVQIKLVWEKKSRRLVGGEIIGTNSHVETIYAIGLAIQQKLTIDQVPYIDSFFLPDFNKPYNFLMLAGMKAIGMNFFEK